MEAAPGRKPRLLLVSFLFPPHNAIGAVRTGKLAKFLLDAGWDVRVIAAQADEPKTLPLEIPAENVVYTKWARVDRTVEEFLARISSSSRKEKVEQPRKSAEPNGAPGQPGFLRATYRKLSHELFRLPDNKVGWLRNAVAAADQLLRNWRPDLIYASAPPVTTVLIADKISRRHNVPWVAEFRDLWMDHPYYEYGAIRRFLEEAWERRVLNRASGIVTVSAPWFELLSEKFAKPVELVMNGFVPEDFPDVPAAMPALGPLRVLFTGQIYSGYRDPTPLFQALHLLGPLKDDVRIEFIGTEPGSIQPIADRVGVSGNVVVCPPVGYRDALLAQTQADILLHLQWNHPKESGTISGKLFEYIGARRPVLGIGYEHGSVAQIIRERDAGIVSNDPKNIATYLAERIREKRSGGVHSLPLSATAGLTRDEQFEKADRFLRKLLATSEVVRGEPAAVSDKFGFASSRHYQRVASRHFARPVVCAIVDVEEEFDWNLPFSKANRSTESLRGLPSAHQLFRKWGVTPTYLIDHPVVLDDYGVEMFRTWRAAKECLVGAQLHPWVTPPNTEEVNFRNSFQGNLPLELEREKLLCLTNTIQTRIGERPVVFKAGRYGLGHYSSTLLEELGYLVDTSVLPRTDMSEQGGPDYSNFSSEPFWFGNDVRILELPVTRGFAGSLSHFGPSLFTGMANPLARSMRLPGVLARLGVLERITLTPEGITPVELRRLTERMLREGTRIFTFSFHGPSLTPGNTPYVRTAADLGKFLATIDSFLEFFLQDLGGDSLSPLEIRDRLIQSGH